MIATIEARALFPLQLLHDSTDFRLRRPFTPLLTVLNGYPQSYHCPKPGSYSATKGEDACKPLLAGVVNAVSSDGEIVAYLQSLIDHRKQCKLEGCRLCVTLHGILDSIRYRIFQNVVYPEVTISVHRSSEPSSAERITHDPSLKKSGHEHRCGSA